MLRALPRGKDGFMCDWGGGPNEAANYPFLAAREERERMEKNKKPPIPINPKDSKAPVIIKGTIEPTTKK